MGCSSSTAAVGDMPRSEAKTKESIEACSTENTQESHPKYPASQAFVIPLDDDAKPEIYNALELVTPSVTKKPPPRIQKLIEEAERTEQSFSLGELEEKLHQAELRRREYLQQKVDNVQKITQLVLRNNDDNESIANKEGVKHPTASPDTKYATDIKSQALDDDRKRELLTTSKNH